MKAFGVMSGRENERVVLPGRPLRLWEKTVNLSRGAERLLDLLRWHGRKFRRIIPTQEDLSGHLHVTMRQIRRYLTELAGLVTVKKCGRHPAEYILSADAVAEKNVRSKSGRSPVEVRSVPYMVFNEVEVGVSVYARRKPPTKELRGADAAQAIYERACREGS
jgi:hypothetical protein